MFKIIATLLVTLPVVAATGTIVCTNEITDLSILDTSVSPPIVSDLTPVVDLSAFSTCALTIKASTLSTPSNCDEQTNKCVKFFLDGVEIRKEKFAPFTMYGDINGVSIARKPPLGVHTIKACTYSDKACTKNENGCMEMEVDFLDCDGAPVAAPVASPVAAPVAAPVVFPVATPVAAPVVAGSINQVTGFQLVDTESPYRPIVTPFSPPIIDLMEFSTCELNIYATVSENTQGDAGIKCVKLTLGSQVRKERFTPFALYGNTGRFIRSGKPALGAQTLKACTYTDEGCSQGESGCLEVDVYVKDCATTAAPLAVPVAAPIAAPVAVPIAPVNAPIAAPVDAPIAAPIVAPVAAPVDAPVEAPVAAPVSAPIEAPIAAPIVAPVAAPVDAPVEAPIAAPVDAPIAAPVSAPVAAPVAAPVEAPIAAPVDAPIAAPVDAPIAAPVDAPVAGPIAAPAPVPVDAPVAAPIIAPAVAPVDAPVAAPIIAPAVAPVDTPVAAPVVAGSINQVTGFQLVDTESPYRPVVTPFSPPIIDLLEFSTCELNIYATVSENTQGDAGIKCVKLTLGSQVRKEKLEPYALYGNTGRFIRSGKPALGAQTLKACSYTDEECSQGESGCLEIDVYVKDCATTAAPLAAPVDAPVASPVDAPVAAPVDAPIAAPVTAPVEAPIAAPVAAPVASPVASPVAAPVVAGSINEVTGFQLVDTESPYRPVITPFSPPIIDLLEFSTCELNIYATVSENTQGDAGIKCVKLTLGSQVRKEKSAPYALYGNTGRFIRSGKPALGAQTLKACTYTDEGCSQGESGCLEVDVYVKDCVSMSM